MTPDRKVFSPHSNRKGGLKTRAVYKRRCLSRGHWFHILFAAITDSIMPYKRVMAPAHTHRRKCYIRTHPIAESECWTTQFTIKWNTLQVPQADGHTAPATKKQPRNTPNNHVTDFVPPMSLNPLIWLPCIQLPLKVHAPLVA